MSIGGSYHDSGQNLITDSEGNVFVTGYFHGIADFDPSSSPAYLVSQGSHDVFITKYSSVGEYLWAINLGGTEVEKGNGITLDSEGNVFVTGYFYGTADFDPSDASANLVSQGNHDVFIAKYNSSGEYVWAIDLGGADWAEGLDISLDSENNVVITGSFYGTADFDPSDAEANLISNGHYDAFVAKYSNAGTYLWAINLGGSNLEKSNGIALDSEGNVFVTGYFYGTADFDPSDASVNLESQGNHDVFVAKYNSSGEYVWAIDLGGADRAEGLDISLDSEDNVFITGSFFGTADFDPSDALANLISNGHYDAFIAKYSNSGECLWAINLGGTEVEKGNGIALDSEGNVFVTGYFYGTADFDPSGASVNLVSQGNHDVFIAKYNSSGKYVWAIDLGGADWAEGIDISLDSEDNVFITGSFYGTADFDPSKGITTITALGAPDIFIAKYYSGIPTIPENFSAIGKDREVILSWDPSKEANVDIYHISKGTDLSAYLRYLVGVHGSVSSYSDQDVINDTLYFYRIRASNANGSSGWSDYVFATPRDVSVPSDPNAKPAIPENFSAIGKNGAVILSWDPSREANVDIYHLVKGTELSEDMPYLVGLRGHIFSYTDRDVTNETTYIYRIIASNTNGFSGWSDYVFAIPQVATTLSIPSEFSAVAGDGEVTLFWKKGPEIDVAMYHLYRSLNSGEEGTYLIGLPNSYSSYVDTTVTNGLQYFYRISASDYNNNFSALSDEINATPKTTLAIKETTTVNRYYLEKNYPNPFNSSTTISFGIPKSGHAVLRVYNINGDMIYTLVDKNLVAGYHSIVWDGMDNAGQTVSAGIYFFHLQAGEFSDTNKMILIK